jgi:nitric oxide dioxygenase
MDQQRGRTVVVGIDGSAIGDVLGDAVTAEVAAAWDEVYWLMAEALINQERGLYSARGVRPETVWRPWQVERKIRETVTS